MFATAYVTIPLQRSKLSNEHNLGWEASKPVEAGETDANPYTTDAKVQLKKRVRDALEEDYGPGGDITVKNVARNLDADSTDVETVLDNLAKETRLIKRTEDGYRLLGGGA